MTLNIKASKREDLVVNYSDQIFTLSGRIPTEIAAVRGQVSRKGVSKKDYEEELGAKLIDAFYELVIPQDFKAVLDLEDVGQVFEGWSKHVGLGIEGLRELAEAHPSELIYELHGLGIRMEDIGETIDHVTVDHLVRVSMRQPSSWLFAAHNGWEYPVSREWMVTADLVDAFMRANAGKRKPKPYPRPWKDNSKTRMGSTKLSPVEARALLARARSVGVGEALEK